MVCKWCNIEFCPTCIAYEIHSCKNISDMKDDYNRHNEELLIKNKVDKVKVIKI